MHVYNAHCYLEVAIISWPGLASNLALSANEAHDQATTTNKFIELTVICFKTFSLGLHKNSDVISTVALLLTTNPSLHEILESVSCSHIYHSSK